MAPPLIYVIDDEPSIARLVQINLEREGYAVQTALDGLEALQALQNNTVQPDLLLLDIMMPYMDGFELLKRLQWDVQFNHIPIVMMTARSRDEDLLLAKHLGANTYLIKPINPVQLLSTVRDVLQKAATATSLQVSTEFLHEN